MKQLLKERAPSELARLERRRDYDREYRRNNREAIRAYDHARAEAKQLYDREYRRANKERRLAYQREYFLSNKEHLTAYHREYRRVNADAVRAQVRKYRQDNPEQWRDEHRRRRAFNIGCIIIERFKAIEIFERDKWRCQRCGCKTPSSLKGTRELNAPVLDHVIPLKLGGPHTKANTQCLCLSCNSTKSAKYEGQLAFA